MSQRIQEPPEAGKTRKWFFLGASVGIHSDGLMASGPQNGKRANLGHVKALVCYRSPQREMDF